MSKYNEMSYKFFVSELWHRSRFKFKSIPNKTFTFVYNFSILSALDG